MKSRLRVLLFACLITALGCISCGGNDGNEGQKFPAQSQITDSPKRIVSTAPNITETLFALGLGEKVAGVTKFCQYPPEAQEKEIIGGYLDMNFEAVASLSPDCVFCLPGHDELRSYLDKLDINHVIVPNESIGDICSTITKIGELCGAEKKASSIIQDIDKRISAIKSTMPEDERPSVLISIGREMGAGTLKEVYVAGPGTFYDELIRCVGGKNAYVGPEILYPSLSSESILTLNPDIIIEIVPDIESRGLSVGEIVEEWEILNRINAYKNDNIHVLTSDYTVIPGPRFIMLLEDFGSIVRQDTSLE